MKTTILWARIFENENDFCERFFGAFFKNPKNLPKSRKNIQKIPQLIPEIIPKTNKQTNKHNAFVPLISLKVLIVFPNVAFIEASVFHLSVTITAVRVNLHPNLNLNIHSHDFIEKVVL